MWIDVGDILMVFIKLTNKGWEIIRVLFNVEVGGKK